MSKVVYLIDDDEAVRKAIALLFTSVQLTVRTYRSGEDFLAAYQPIGPQDRACAVTDLRMPGMSGLELQRELHRAKINIPLIVISGYADIPRTVQAMRGGALTVLEKPVNEQELIDVVHQALHGTVLVDGPGQAVALDRYQAQLTERQREVFDLLMRGLQTKEVARQLGLSYRTVEVHRSQILKRLQVSSISQLLKQILVRPSQN